MSGSIFGNRIRTKEVQPTINKYIDCVLSKFKSQDFNYVKCVPTGSYNRYIKNNLEKEDGHGDIDLIIYIKLKNNKYNISSIKKEFCNYLSNLSDDVTVPFRDGNNKGKKAQLFGSIVTCGFPIVTDDNNQSPDNYVQIDNMIVIDNNDYKFQSNFFNLSIQTQSTLQGLFRCFLYEDKYLNTNILSQFEYNLSYNKLTIRKITYFDSKDWKEDKSKRVVLKETNDWDQVIELITNHSIYLYRYIMNDDYINLIKYINLVFSQRSKNRIFGVINSMIRIGENEIGTIKGNEKANFIEYVKNTFNIL